MVEKVRHKWSSRSSEIGSAPCEGCLRTFVEGIKPFVVHPGVEILKTCFPLRPLRSSLYVV